MNIGKKIEIVETAVKSIATHDDQDSVVLLAALDAVTAIVDKAKAQVAAKAKADAAAAVTPASA